MLSMADERDARLAPASWRRRSVGTTRCHLNKFCCISFEKLSTGGLTQTVKTKLNLVEKSKCHLRGGASHVRFRVSFCFFQIGNIKYRIPFT